MTFSLMQNYPNPFNPTTKIAFEIPTSGHVTLKVFDLLGRDVATLVNEAMSAGRHETGFDPGNIAGGFYIYRLQSGHCAVSKKLIYLK